MKITWMGTASFSIESGGERLLFDPYLQMRGGENFVSFDDLLEFDTVFVTHCHFDHLMYVPELLEEGEATVFCTEQCCRTMERYTDQNDRMVCVRPGNEISLGGVRIEVLKGKHIDFQLSHLTDSLTPLRLMRYARNIPSLFWANHAFKEAGEIVAYRIRWTRMKSIRRASTF